MAPKAQHYKGENMKRPNFTNTMIPEMVPAISGIGVHVNRYGEPVALTASRNLKERCDAAKMDRYFNEAKLRKEKATFDGTTYTNSSIVKYPESLKQIVVLPMPFEDADRVAKILRKAWGIKTRRYYNSNTYDVVDDSSTVTATEEDTDRQYMYDLA